MTAVATASPGGPLTGGRVPTAPAGRVRQPEAALTAPSGGLIGPNGGETKAMIAGRVAPR
jgi:hypothetical protein